MNLGVASLVAVAVLASGLAINDAHALSPNKSLVVEGSGYLATEKTIKTSDLDILLETGTQSGSRTDITIESGLVTLGGDDYMITESSATSLREGKYIRISATAESSDGRDEITISTLGRLIQDSQSGSVYTFSGRIVDGSTTYRIIYIGHVSALSTSDNTKQSESDDGSIVVKINEGASNSALAENYIKKNIAQTGYFSVDRLSITPGTTVTFVNDDIKNHTLVSGTGLTSARQINTSIIVCESEEKVQEGGSYKKNKCDFTLDGRLDSGVIAPGKSWTVTFKDMGFYRLVDTEYPWMNLVVYNFPKPD